MLKSLPTIYKGIEFRSRLEARWALFFDKVGLLYDYEPQGFNVGEVNYLPDFYLPSVWQGSYFEIKPRLWQGESEWFHCWWASDADDKNIEKKASGLAAVSKKPVFVISGNPFPKEYRACYYSAEGSGDTPMIFTQCLKCGAVGITYEGRTDYIGCGCNNSKSDYGVLTPFLEACYIAATKKKFYPYAT